MKKQRYLLSIAILPFLMMISLNYNQGKSNGKGNQKEKSDKHQGKNDNHNEKYNDHPQNKNSNKSYEKKGNAGNKIKNKDLNGKNAKWKVDERWDDKKWDDNRFDTRMGKIKDFKKSKWVNSVYYPGIVWFTGDSYNDVKYPKNQKKVSVCHKPNGSNNPVQIEVSVNALKAHLNHGDYEGQCNDYDRTRYSDVYFDTRESYYTQYTQTTETLSLGEQLLALAIDKLTNSRQQLNSQRTILTPQEVSRKEVAIINLQNDTYVLQNSLERGNTRVTQVNYVF
ncbi:hypothetical protein [Pedobacter alpinus]|uniref:Uncharacterized protein n=1 Tax=Pedobacter alpinus TaxID=1590643 RepID=A0ABW5TR75_9SPHI